MNPIRCCAVALLMSVTAASAQAPRLTPAEWRADLRWLDSTIRVVHPAPFHRVPESTYARTVSALARDIPRLTDTQVAVRMMAIVALLNDGHSHMQGGAPIIAGNTVFPIRIDHLADGIRVIATRDVDAPLLGAEVLRIGGVAATVAWDSLLTVSSGDNVFSRLSSAPVRAMTPAVMSALGLASDSLVLHVRKAGGDSARVAIPAVTGMLDHRRMATSWEGSGGATRTALSQGGDAAWVGGRRSAAYWYAERGPLLYVQINQVGDSRDTTAMGNSRAVVTLAEFTSRVMARIDSGGIDRLVLDLRFNGGGNNALARPFVNGVAARPAINQRGKVFVITGRITYSAAMNFVSMMEDRTEALFVGEAPGGAPSHYGDAVPLVMPKSRMTVRLSTLHWDTGVAPDDTREVMEPDLPAPPRLADLAAGIDAPLRAIEAYSPGSSLTEQLMARYRAAGFDAAGALYDSLHAATSAGLRAPWSSDAQALLDFAWSVIPAARSRDDIFRGFALATDRYPDSHPAWQARARVLAFINDWPGVRDAYAKALALRPASSLLRRQFEASRRR